jgi:hypothetical protein
VDRERGGLGRLWPDARASRGATTAAKHGNAAGIKGRVTTCTWPECGDLPRVENVTAPLPPPPSTAGRVHVDELAIFKFFFFFLLK